MSAFYNKHFWFNAEDWKLVPGPFFQDFNEMTISQDLSIFSS